jgi:hypothetical protein
LAGLFARLAFQNNRELFKRYQGNCSPIIGKTHLRSSPLLETETFDLCKAAKSTLRDDVIRKGYYGSVKILRRTDDLTGSFVSSGVLETVLERSLVMPKNSMMRLVARSVWPAARYARSQCRQFPVSPQQSSFPPDCRRSISL